MIRSLYTAASGMKANQTFVDNISHNLSNVNTVGYKKSKIEFEDLMYQTLQEPGGQNGDGTRAPVGIQIGLGTKVLATNKLFMQGNLEQTGNNLDVAIEGDGFFQVRLTNGEVAYTRAGAFKISGDGYLTTSQGNIVEPGISISDDVQDLYIDASGRILGTLTAGELPEELGQLELARLVNPAGLRSHGSNLFTLTEASG